MLIVRSKCSSGGAQRSEHHPPGDTVKVTARRPGVQKIIVLVSDGDANFGQNSVNHRSRQRVWGTRALPVAVGLVASTTPVASSVRLRKIWGYATCLHNLRPPQPRPNRTRPTTTSLPPKPYQRGSQAQKSWVIVRNPTKSDALGRIGLWSRSPRERTERMPPQ